MTQLVPRTFSPSSLRMTRSTPCVDGCCGPMLMTSSVESKNVASGIRGSLSAFDTQVLPNPALVLLKNRIILSQRVALPLLGHEYPLHVRVPGELDAEHIEHLAFQPVGRQVDAHGGLGLEAVGDVGLDPLPLVARETVNHVDQIETLGPLGPVHRRNVHQIIEVRFELQVLQHRDDAIRRGNDEVLPEVGGRLLHAIAEPLLQVASQIAVPEGGHHDGGRGRDGFRGGRSGSGWLYRRLRGLLLRGRRPLGALWFLLVGHSLSSRESYTYHLRRWGVTQPGAAVST